MTQGDRFFKKALPTDEEWRNLRDLIEANGHKIIMVEKTFWHNKLTRKKGIVEDIPIFARRDDGSRPWAVTKITMQNGEESSPTKSWYFNEYYYHQNLQGSQSIADVIVRDTNGKAVHLGIEYQEICSPITAHHFYTKDERTITLLMKGQLTGQNGGSPFQTVDSLENATTDFRLKDNYGNLIKNTAPVIQLLLKRDLDTIKQWVENNPAEIKRTLAEARALPVTDDQVLVKYCLSEGYSIEKATQVDELLEEGKISKYYPVITYQQAQDILENLPKPEVDLACLGLGSAGTGILDQLARCTYMNTFLICDFDKVEEKNLRNQWYRTCDIGMSKVGSANDILNKCIPSSRKTADGFRIINKECKFQDAGLEGYKFGYVISGFDSIDARLELFNKIKGKEIETAYLIDTRYDALEASVFFINTDDEGQMNAYEKGLLQAKEVFDEMESKRGVSTYEEFIEYLQENHVFTRGCMGFHNMLGISQDDDRGCPGDVCGNDACRAHFAHVFQNNKEKINKLCRKPEPESTCVMQNFIDIYKYASTFVFSAVRELEEGRAKPFTHIECAIDGLPQYMVVKK